MSNNQFSAEFDALVSSYRRFRGFDSMEALDSIEFNEYEKSLYLTQAQEEVIISLYNGKNYFEDSFESTEEIRRYLNELVKTKVYEKNSSIWTENTDISPVTSSSKFFKLPSDLYFITYEQVVFEDDSLGCYSGQTADVYPVTQDEYNRIARNPFRGPNKHRVLRLDTGNTYVEIISKYDINKYLIKYLSKPSPIVLVNLPNGLEIEGISIETPCTLNESLHNTILKRAVGIALASKTMNNKDNGDPKQSR